MKLRLYGKLLPGLLCLVLLTGCYDSMEPENRGFVITLGIDPYSPEDEPAFDNNSGNEQYTVTMELPDVEAMANKSEGGQGNVKSSSSETIAASLYEIDSYASKQLYYGHTKVVIFNEAVLMEPALLKGAVDALERNKELSRKILILASKEKAKDIVGYEEHSDATMGMYISNFYKKNSDIETATFRLDLDGLSEQLIATGNVLIPFIDITDLGIKIGGAAIIRDFELVGYLNDVHQRGYAWITSGGKGAQVTVEYQDQNGNAVFVPMKVESNQSKISFREEGGQLVCTAAVKIGGSISQYRFGDTSLFDEDGAKQMGQYFERQIGAEMAEIFDLFQKEYQIDGLQLSETLYKFYNSLYKKYESNWEEAFANMVFEPMVTVEIQNTGALK